MLTALVTGAAGFVGRHMVSELAARGYSVEPIDIAWGNDAFEVFASEKWSFDLVVHAAAQEPHRLAIDTKPEAFVYNSALDAAMFNWAIRTHQRHVLYLSSSAVYPATYQGNRYARRLAEHLVGGAVVREPDSNYGWAKLHGERMADVARASGVPVTVVRPFSGYGEDQSLNFPFRAIIERARAREVPLTIWGTGWQVRDWIHIDDVVKAALACVGVGVAGPINLCTGVGTSIRELARMASDLMGYNPSIESAAGKPSGVHFRVGDPGWLHEIYVPAITIEEGVKRALTTG